MSILHIVPNQPQKADIALSIASGLRSSCQLDSTFYSPEANLLDQHINMPFGFDSINTPISSLEEKIPDSITAIVLHVNYATYRSQNSKRKASKFVSELKKVIELRSLKLIAIFHEIPTSKLHKIFTINPRHQFLTKQLADLATYIITSNKFYENYLIKNTNTPTTCVNHFSRAGELESNNLLGASRCNLVILGGIERANIYKKKALLKRICETLKINQIVDIGIPLNWSKIDTKDLNIRQMGELLKSDVSDQLTISKVGIMDYSRYPSCLGKSSVFNAYKAHGVAPLLLKDINPNNGDIISGVNYFTSKDIESLKSNRSIARMAHANYAQYQTHNQSQWVQLINGLVSS